MTDTRKEAGEMNDAELSGVAGGLTTVGEGTDVGGGGFDSNGGFVTEPHAPAKSGNAAAGVDPASIKQGVQDAVAEAAKQRQAAVDRANEAVKQAQQFAADAVAKAKGKGKS